MFTHRLLGWGLKNTTDGEVRMITWDFHDGQPSLANLNALAETHFPDVPKEKLEIGSGGGEIYSIGFMRQKGDGYLPFEGDLPMPDTEARSHTP